MIKIGDLGIYIGVKDEYGLAVSRGMKIVCALDRAAGFVSHQSVVGWKGRGCDPAHPDYLYKLSDDAIYLNMVDGDSAGYIKDVMIDVAIGFIDDCVRAGNEVFVYCSRGVSRSPSIVLMYMLEKGLIGRDMEVFNRFKKEYYRGYSPGAGNRLYIRRRWEV